MVQFRDFFKYDYKDAHKGDKGFCWRLQRKPIK